MANNVQFVLSLLLCFIWSVKTELRLGCWHTISFDRRDGWEDHHLVDNSRLEVATVSNDAKCFFMCYLNCQCLSFNVCGTKCELNTLNSFLTPEGAIQKKEGCRYYDQPLDEVYCKRCMRCKNGGQCNVNHWKRTYQCRCPLQYSGKQCEKSNTFGSNLEKIFGVARNGLFHVIGKFNWYDQAKTVCEAFGARLATTNEIGQSAFDDGRSRCSRGWTHQQGLGYPEFQGGCHVGSNFTGYLSYDCCPDLTNTVASVWCIKKGLDYCKPNWYAFGISCFMFNNDEKLTWMEAKEKCAANNGNLAKIETRFVGHFIKKTCPVCTSMFVGIQKVVDTWTWIPAYNTTHVTPTLWSSGEPQGNDTCAEWNTELNGLKAVPCSAKRGYVCMMYMF